MPVVRRWKGVSMVGSWPPYVRIEYVDGSFAEGPAGEWPTMPADKVNKVIVNDFVLMGTGLYWAYPETITTSGETAAVFGQGSLYAAEIREMLFRENGEMLVRRRRGELPDLLHNQLKLGWWRTSLYG